MVRNTTTDKASVTWHIAKLESLRKRGPLRATDRWSVLRVFYGCKEETLENKASTKTATNARHRTARLLGTAPSTVSRLVTSWVKQHRISNSDDENEKYCSVLAPASSGNTKPKPKRIPDDSEVLSNVSDFVQSKRCNGERVTCRKVLLFLNENGYCTLQQNTNGSFDPNDFASAQGSVQRYLKKKGFKRGSKSKNVQISPVIQAWMDQYIRTILCNRSMPESTRLQEVYTDESYIHHHHKSVRENLYFLDVDYFLKTQRKGKKLCFVAAIQNNGRFSDAGLVPGSLRHFCPQQKKDHRGDYHKVFNSNHHK